MKDERNSGGAVSSSFLKHSKIAEGQLTQLAGAIPQDRFTWRPGAGARSIAEAFLHAAWGNYLIMQSLGVQAPGGVDLQTYESSTTDKRRIVEELKRSFEAMNTCVSAIPESDYDVEVEFFGMKLTKLDMIFSAATHQWESLGQAIAYSRANQIAPPWTVARQTTMKSR
jgi:hypothetical protein